MSATIQDVALERLRVFAAVADHTSFSKAAKALGMSKGTVSRGIAALESQLELELLHRSTRHVALSTAGVALHERIRHHLAALHKAVVDLPERDEAPSGLLRMTAPIDFGAIVLPPVLTAFTRRYPAVRFDVRLTEGRVDLVRDGYDLGVRAAAGPMKDSALIVRRLGGEHGAFYAAPAYLARRGRPRSLGDDRHAWAMHPSALKLLRVPAEAVKYLVDDFMLARQLLREGAAIGLLPAFVARPDLRDGVLEEVSVPGYSPVAGQVVLVYPSSGQVPRKVAAFRDFLVEAMRNGGR